MVRIIVGMRTHPELKVLNSMNCPNRGTQSFFSQFLLNQAFKQPNKRFFKKILSPLVINVCLTLMPSFTSWNLVDLKYLGVTQVLIVGKGAHF